MFHCTTIWILLISCWRTSGPAKFDPWGIIVRLAYGASAGTEQLPDRTYKSTDETPIPV